MIARNVARERAGLRLDRFLALELTDFSRARLQALIRGGFVRLNGKAPRPRDLVRAGDAVELTEPAIEKIEAQPERMALDGVAKAVANRRGEVRVEQPAGVRALVEV